MIDENPIPDLVAEREHRAHAIAQEIMERRLTGEALSDDDVLADYPDLMRELRSELSALRHLTEAIAIARRSLPLTQSIKPLPADKLDEPLDEDSEEAPTDPDDLARPIIPGLRIIQPIDKGGQATVYLAVHERTGERVALKVLTGGAWIDSRQRSRFDREARILATLNHPNIVKVVDRGRTHSGAFFIALEYVNGCSFEDFAAECAKTDSHHPRRLLQTLAKAARALHVAHLSEIIHRDLKPSNIRVEPSGEPRILDFGLAIDLTADPENITHTGQWVGSLPWWSPEQVLNGSGAVTVKSDIYSLGIVLYQALAGEFPYTVGESVKVLLDQIARKSVQPPSRSAKWRCSNGRAIDAVVLKAISKSAAQRHATAEQLADDLDALAVEIPPRWTIVPSRPIFRWSVTLLVCAAATITWVSQLSSAKFVPGAELPHRTNWAGMTFVCCRPGKLILSGSEFGLGDHPNAVAHVIVSVDKPFWLQTTEVTARQFSTVMGTPLPPGTDGNLPATAVTFVQATKFCEILSHRDGHYQYRLPTEQEWVYAYHCGHQSLKQDPNPTLPSVPQRGIPPSPLHSVGQTMPNDFGVYDLSGDAKEWCISDPTVTPPACDPADACPGVLRGGSLLVGKCRIAPSVPNLADRPMPLVGFRVILVDLPGGP